MPLPGKLASSVAGQSAWDPEYTVIDEPDDYYGRPGDIATFIVEAEGKNLSYQWLYQAPGTDEFVYCTSSDATTNTLRVEMTAESDGAQYRCFITDANGDMGSTRCATVKLDVRDWTMEYEAGGLRTKRSSAEKTYNYIYSGDKLVRMTCGDNILDFTYDANGAPLTLVTGGKVYYYLTNLQGDVISVESSDGTPVASYCYGAWGKILSSSGDLAELNPLRYRGYVYDQETGFYYVESRYYDPAIRRFINADSTPSTGQDVSGTNMYAYCGNNPVSRVDDGGEFWNYVIGAAVGGVVAAVTHAVTSENANWKSIFIAGVAGATSGAIAASGLGMFTQAAITTGVTFAGDVSTQVVSEKKTLAGNNKVDYKKAIWNSGLAGVTSIGGSILGSVTSVGYTTRANDTMKAAGDKLLTGYVRQSFGRSYSKLIRQGRNLLRTATKLTNISRAISSITGTLSMWGIGVKYSK